MAAAKGRSTLEWVLVVLVTVAALNWGVFALFGRDVLVLLFGGLSQGLVTTLYYVVAVGGVYFLYLASRGRV